jgi:2-iminobutanoate/2-iminopropanoate deaminase
MKKPFFYLLLVAAVAGLFWIVSSAKKTQLDHHAIINTPAAPKPIGPYSQAVRRGNAVFVSGQIGIDSKTGLLDTTSIEAETKIALNNIRAILKEADMTMNDIARTTIYMTDLKNFSRVNEIYATYFGKGPFPARETVQVVALPKGAHIEISAMAVK